MHAEMHVGLNDVCISYQILMENGICQQISVMVPTVKLHENLICSY